MIQAIQERITNEKEAREKAEKALNTFKQAQITTVVEGAVKVKNHRSPKGCL